MGDDPFSNALKVLESPKISADRVSAHYGFLAIQQDGEEAGTRMMHLVLDFDRELAKIGE